MKFKKDWSFAYFLYYVCQIGFWLLLINAGIMLLFNAFNLIGEDEQFFIHDVPVVLGVDELSSFQNIQKEQVNIHIYNTVKASVGISGTFNNHIPTFLYYYGLKLYETLFFLSVLFFFGKLLKNVAEGNPFAPSNSKYLSIIGWILFLCSSLNILIGYLPFPLLQDLSVQGGLEFSSVSVFRDYMLEGIFIIVLGYVFNEGTRIYEEQKLTV
jgi:hypothetical protein